MFCYDFPTNCLTYGGLFFKFAEQEPIHCSMAKQTPVEQAVKTITRIGGWAYKDPTYNYDWIIICPRILGRQTYNCCSDRALIAWAEKYSQPQK